MTAPATRPRARPEAGSAYVIVLLALVVLSILALSLSLVTQTEVQIATNETMAQRSFYAGDSGLNLAVARVLTVNSSVDETTVTAVTPMRFTLPDTSTVPGVRLAQEVELTPFVPIRASFCDMCPAGEGDVKLQAINHAVAATARRVAWSGASATPPEDARTFAQKRVYVMIGLQPWWPPAWQSIADASQLAEVDQTTAGMYEQ